MRDPIAQISVRRPVVRENTMSLLISVSLFLNPVRDFRSKKISVIAIDVSATTLVALIAFVNGNIGFRRRKVSMPHLNAC